MDPIKGMELAEYPEDGALLERIHARDADALLELYRRYGPRVLALAHRLLGDRSAAEEVVQDAFWKLWQRPALFNPERGVLLAWLYTVVRNLALDRRRRKNRRVTECVTDSIDVFSHGVHVGEMVELTDPTVVQAVREAMQTLPPEQRDAIELAYFEGMTQTEIAARQGTPLGTVKTRLRLGLNRLREAMTGARMSSAGKMRL